MAIDENQSELVIGGYTTSPKKFGALVSAILKRETFFMSQGPETDLLQLIESVFSGLFENLRQRRAPFRMCRKREVAAGDRVLLP
jgi:hypothetical protein